MSNFNFNKVILGGRLTADPELKTTSTGITVVTVSMAVNRRTSKEQQTDFFRVTAWRTTAEFISKYFRKGSAICVVGTLQNNSYTDQQGQKRTFTDIVADEVMFVDSRSDNPASNGDAMPSAQPSFTPNFADTDSAKFQQVKGDDDLPF
jgi:single-strand DNA-binding protein